MAGAIIVEKMSRGRLLILGVRSLIVAAIAAPFWFWRGGVLELEVLQFIEQYLDHRSLLQKVFNPYANDFNTYQARELSYFIDYLDARVFERLMHWNVVSFIPLSAVAASVLSVAVFHWGARRYRAVPALTGALLLLLYLSNYVHLVTMGMFYRSAKPLLTPVVMATAFYIASILDADRRPKAPLAIFVLLSLMSLLDRQGFFYAAAAVGILAGFALLERGRWALVLSGAAALACLVGYDVWLGPAIVKSVSNYTPSLAYQKLPVAELIGSPAPYVKAVELLSESATVMMGSLSPWLAGIALTALVTAAVWRSGPMVRSRLLLAGTVVSVLAASVFMFAVMVIRHPPLYDWIDHRYWYYPLPFQALLICLIVILLDRVVAGWSSWKPAALNLLLALAIAGNVAQWTTYRELMLTSRWFSRVYPQTALLRTSIEEGRPHPNLIRQYRKFYDLCVLLSPDLKSRNGR